MDRRRALVSVHMGTDNPIAPSEPIIDINNYLTIEALELISIQFTGDACEYCVNGDGNWTTLNTNEYIYIFRRQYVSFRGELTPAINVGIGSFDISGKCNLKGNCMSMLFGDNAANNLSLTGKDYAFYELFYNCTNIVNVSENFLPATTLADYCYGFMFSGCSSLTTAPALPATTLASSCYRGMFRNCFSLTTVPELPATTLKTYCYGVMFQGCSSLTTAPYLPATTLASSCYYGMFSNCTNLTTAPYLPATTLASSCYNSMFWVCTSLTTAPELPATTLASNCYNNMFYGCNKLNYIKMLATNISAGNCLTGWVYNVASAGTFVKNSAMDLPTATQANSYVGIPEGWTVIDDGEYSGGLITFTIDGVEYQAEEGMTWGEWVNSEYNVNGEFTVDLDDSILYGWSRWVGTEVDYVYASHIIEENYNYAVVV